jgi:hypothetical protein
MSAPVALETGAIPLASGLAAQGWMKSVAFVDAELRRQAGHHANACRHVVGELRRRGLRVDVYAHRSVETELIAELGAIPHFHHSAYAPIAAHRPVRALQALDVALARASFGLDLRRLWQGGYDLVFFNSVLGPQMEAVAAWLASFPPDRTPSAAVEFGAPSGRAIERPELARWWRHHPPCYRRAGARLSRAGIGARLVLFAFGTEPAEDYSTLLGRPVHALPPVHAGVGRPRLRRRGVDGRVTVAFLGLQRPEKGYALLPDVIREVLRRNRPVQILVHNGAPTTVAMDQQIEELSRSDQRVIFEHRSADQRSWQDLLDRTDLLVLPYVPSRYRASYSAVAIEAVSDGIPVVTPAGTTMATLAGQYQRGASTFEDWTAPAVVEAIDRALDTFDDVASVAAAGAVRWRRDNGAAAFMDRLVPLLPSSLVDVDVAAGGPRRGDAVRAFGLETTLAAFEGLVDIVRAIRCTFEPCP